jgi:hypothetical protein
MGSPLDLRQRFRLLGGRKVARALAGNGHEGRLGRDHNVHASIRSLHLRSCIHRFHPLASRNLPAGPPITKVTYGYSTSHFVTAVVNIIA